MSMPPLPPQPPPSPHGFPAGGPTRFPQSLVEPPTSPPGPTGPPPGPIGPTPPYGGAARQRGVKWESARVGVPGSASTFVVAVSVGVFFDAMVRTRVDGIAGAGLLLVMALGLVASRRLRTATSIIVAALSTPFAMLLVVRTSWWVVTAAAVGAAFLVGVAASFGGGGSVWRQHRRTISSRSGRAVVSAVRAPWFLGRSASATVPPSARQSDRVIPVLRGVLIAMPLVVIVGMLLASADAVFASFFQLPFTLEGALEHAALLVIGSLIGAALLAEASAPPIDGAPPSAARFGSTEATVVLAGLVVVLGLFAAAQAMVAAGGAEVVLHTAGLTRADYARSGFFQLVAVAVVIAVVLLTLRANVCPAGPAARRWFVALGELAVALTLVVVAVSIVRLYLYDQAYGITSLRLAVTVAALWIGTVFVLIGGALARPIRPPIDGVTMNGRRNWLLPAIVGSAMLFVLLTAMANPERLIVQRNLDHYARTGMLDAPYLGSVSDDGVPVLAARFGELPGDAQLLLRRRWCFNSLRRAEAPSGWAWNHANAEASTALEQICGP